MLHRSNSKTMDAAPRPTYMSNKQMGDYLHDLRTNRPARPTGARPPPQSKTKRQSLTLRAAGPSTASPSHQSLYADDVETAHTAALPDRSSSRLSVRGSIDATVSRRMSSQDMNRLAREETDRRQKERLEAREMRLALAEADDVHDEERIYLAAQKEAEELIWKHRYPDAPYKPKGETKDLASPEKVATRGLINLEASVDEVADNSLQETSVPQDRGSTGTLQQPSYNEDALDLKKQRSTSRLAHFSITSLANRRKSSGNKRKSSGGRRIGFPNAEEKIYEDPVDGPSQMDGTAEAIRNEVPAAIRKNPFARAHAARQSMSKSTGRTDTFNRVEIQKNEPSQSRNPAYTSNLIQQQSTAEPEGGELDVKFKNGVEVRADDIRAATSMRMRDRSPKLPTPTAVTDSPGRPIVSFKPDWTPPADESLSHKLGYAKDLPSSPSRSMPRASPEPIKADSAPAVPTLARPLKTSTALEDQFSSKLSMTADHAKNESMAKSEAPPRSISVSDHTPAAAKRPSPSPSQPVPAVVAPDIPTIAVDCASAGSAGASQSRRIEPQKKAAAQPPIPVINEPRPSPKKSATAPASSMPMSNISLKGASALCAQCALPISGKIVSAAGTRFHPQCFTCYHCGEGLECIAFYPEPTERRQQRLARHEQKINGEHEESPEPEDDDGDDSLRFYCHLDFHELFSPRCKSCKTPIEGEVIVACGAEWHVGHFFCAQCGDPFNPSTPFVEKEGYAWCVNCHTNRYAAKCRKCRRPVTGVVVQALGAEWHDDCFCCTECSSKFTDGRFFLKGDSQAPVCPACQEKSLK